MKTVLIIDDEKDVRDLLTVSLSAEGWLVQSTDSLLGALHIYSQHNDIACTILDYNLPGMPMEDFLLQAQTTAPNTCIILITAVDRVEEKAARFGFKHFLGKPIDFEELRRILSECVGEK